MSRASTFLVEWTIRNQRDDPMFYRSIPHHDLIFIPEKTRYGDGARHAPSAHAAIERRSPYSTMSESEQSTNRPHDSRD
jgi:hypothetical protein